MLRQIADIDVAEPVRRYAFDVQLVERAGEFRREPNGLATGRAALFLDQPRQDQLALQRVDRGRDRSSSGSPIGTRRGSSSPPSARRTNAFCIARAARLFGTRTSPRASVIRSRPSRAISPAASASAKLRCGGMV
jgi:hypothetical protein